MEDGFRNALDAVGYASLFWNFSGAKLLKPGGVNQIGNSKFKGKSACVFRVGHVTELSKTVGKKHRC